MTTLKEDIERRATPVGFRRVSVLPTVSVKCPEGTILWSAPYARLALWPIKVRDAAALRLGVDSGEAWLDLAIRQSEQALTTSGIAIDGYLIVSLPEQPSLDVETACRQIELSTTICRKNVVWPDTDGAFSQLERVSALSPKFENGAWHEIDWPSLDDSEEDFLSRLREDGGPSRMADDDLAETSK